MKFYRMENNFNEQLASSFVNNFDHFNNECNYFVKKRTVAKTIKCAATIATEVLIYKRAR